MSSDDAKSDPQMGDFLEHDVIDENGSPSSPRPSTKLPADWTSLCEDLLYFFASHKAAGTLRAHPFLATSFALCADLFGRDGDIITIDNCGQQELCDSYPIKLILQKSYLDHIDSVHPIDAVDAMPLDVDHESNDHGHSPSDGLCRLLERARFARVHRRFVAPVIFLPNDQCIARSSTLSTAGELLLNKATSVVSDALLSAPCSLSNPRCIGTATTCFCGSATGIIAVIRWRARWATTSLRFVPPTSRCSATLGSSSSATSWWRTRRECMYCCAVMTQSDSI